jgi:LysM repeat protein
VSYVTRVSPLVLAGWLLTAGCSGEVGTTPSVTASLRPFSSATPSRTATPWAAAPKETIALEPSPTPFVHIVEKGETLGGIAFQYGIELDQLLAANPNVDPHFLPVGQSLSIPGPNGEPAQSLLPTSTPLPLTVSATRCFPTPSGRLLCLASVSNPGVTAVEALSGQITLLDASGEALDSKLAYAPLNLLPAGGAMPLFASFDRPDDRSMTAQTEIRSAVAAQTPSDRYLEVDTGTPTVTYSSDRRQASVEGTLSVASSKGQGDWREALMALAYDASGAVVGFAKWDSGADPVNSKHEDFAFDVYSLGPPIERVTLMAEARLVAPSSATPAP